MSDELALLRTQAEIRLAELDAQSPAKDVAGRAIGKNGLAYITLIVVIGVGAALFLDEKKLAPVMGLLGASLTALISMLNGIAGASPKQEKPEFEVIRELIGKLDKLHREEQAMQVEVDGERVTVRRGEDSIVTKKGA